MLLSNTDGKISIGLLQVVRVGRLWSTNSQCQDQVIDLYSLVPLYWRYAVKMSNIQLGNACVVLGERS